MLFFAFKLAAFVYRISLCRLFFTKEKRPNRFSFSPNLFDLHFIDSVFYSAATRHSLPQKAIP